MLKYFLDLSSFIEIEIIIYDSLNSDSLYFFLNILYQKYKHKIRDCSINLNVLNVHDI